MIIQRPKPSKKKLRDPFFHLFPLKSTEILVVSALPGYDNEVVELSI